MYCTIISLTKLGADCLVDGLSRHSHGPQPLSIPYRELHFMACTVLLLIMLLAICSFKILLNTYILVRCSEGLLGFDTVGDADDFRPQGCSTISTYYKLKLLDRGSIWRL